MAKKIKLLYLSQCFPLPLDGGGKIKTFNTLQALAKSKQYDISACFVSEREAEPNALRQFKKLGITVKIFKTDLMTRNIKQEYLKLIWNYFQLRPHFVYQYRYKPSFTWIKKKIKTWQPDVIHVDHINSTQFVPSKKWLVGNCQLMPKLILENHNLNHILFATRFKITKKMIRKLYLFLEGSLNWLYGEINYRRFDHVFTISDTETEYLKNKVTSVSTQPMVYPLSRKKTSKKKIYDVLFIGFLDWPPNELAVRWFVEEILPLINQKKPEVKFHVIGKENPKLNDLKKYSQIVFHGYQKSLDTFLGQSKVFALPFQTGAGVRIKSLTAMQNGIPIVSTSVGVDGLHLSDGKEYLRAESAQEFSKQILRLLNNTKLREAISNNQQHYFLHNHSRKANFKYLKKYQEIITQ